MGGGPGIYFVFRCGGGPSHSCASAGPGLRGFRVEEGFTFWRRPDPRLRSRGAGIAKGKRRSAPGHAVSRCRVFVFISVTRAAILTKRCLGCRLRDAPHGALRRPSGLGYVCSPAPLGPVRSPVESCVQLLEVALEARFVLRPCQAIHAGSGVPFEFVEGVLEPLDGEMVEERSQLLSSFALRLAVRGPRL